MLVWKSYPYPALRCSPLGGCPFKSYHAQNDDDCFYDDLAYLFEDAHEAGWKPDLQDNQLPQGVSWPTPEAANFWEYVRAFQQVIPWVCPECLEAYNAVFSFPPGQTREELFQLALEKLPYYYKSGKKWSPFVCFNFTQTPGGEPVLVVKKLPSLRRDLLARVNG